MTRGAKWLTVLAGCGMMVAGAQSVRAQTQAQGPAALESGAVALLQGWADFKGAANMFAKAATLRSADDPQAVKDLIAAGVLYAQAGKLGKAAKVTQAAGERAMALGIPGDAAEAFTNAAFIAAKNGARDNAAVLAHRALFLADVEGVSNGQRALVHARLAS